jgi:hypothetical protein
MVVVTSSMMDAVDYDADTHRLRIRFESGGWYSYRDVPAAVFRALLEAPSKGRFFHDRIDGHYRYVREGR